MGNCEAHSSEAGSRRRRRLERSEAVAQGERCRRDVRGEVLGTNGRWAWRSKGVVLQSNWIN